MKSLIADKQTFSLKEAITILQKKIQKLWQTNTPEKEKGRYRRVEIKVEPQNILSWLRQQTNPVKLYWKDRSGELTVAGIGATDILGGNSSVDYAAILTHINNNLSTLDSNQRYYGGICFDVNNGYPKEEWENFGSYTFILPQVELLSVIGNTYLACNFCIENKDQESLDTILQNLSQLTQESAGMPSQIPLPLTRADYPPADAWQNYAQNIIASCQKETYEKVVLARKTIFTFPEPVNPFTIMQQLGQLTSQCFLFLFQVNEGEVFLGASPERLFKRKGRFIQTEAIAGTRQRGQSGEQDMELIKELAQSTKDFNEHRFVVDMIRKNLSTFCEALNDPQNPLLLSLKGGHHLISQFRGELKKNVSDADLLAALHPTPAVAGCPTVQALNEIKDKEPFNRGWYAGPLGYVGRDETEFIVAIRSGLLHNIMFSLFAGAGIIGESNSLAEWNETEHKLNTFLKIFDASPQVTEY